MDERICGTCRHFERAPEAGRGWCRNPRLYTAGQSQPVSETELACATRQGDFWEASEELSGEFQVFEAGPDSPVERSVEYDDDEVQSGGSQMRGSGSDRPRSSDDQTYGQGDVTAPRSARNPGGGERVPPTPGSGGGSGDRPSGYQTEERYWTDYLRIALPIAGLLLLLSVFWFWASSFIGGNDDANQTPVVAVVTPQGGAVASPTLQGVVVLPSPTLTPVTQPTETPVEPTEPIAQPTETPAQPTSAPEQPTDGEFQEGDFVIVNDNNVNMRSDPTTAAAVVDTLSFGTELRILSGTPTDDGEYVWWNVRDDTTGSEGWVASILLDK